MERLHHLKYLSPTGKVFDEMLRDLTSPGSPVFFIPKPEELGYPARKDTDDTLTPSQINEAIFQEGMRLAGTEVIDIGNNKELFVFNTSVASSHTVLTVNYQEWEALWRKNANEMGIDIPNKPLIHGEGHSEENPKVPALIPLDMVTWVMLRDHNTNTFMPCDVNDLTSLPTGNPHIDRHKLHLSDTKLTELYSAISNRNRLAISTILDLHNNVICKEIPYFRKKEESDLMIGCLSGYYRGDEAKHLKQFDYDHRGKGPMSNPTLHFRITDHFTMEDATLLDQETPGLSFREMIKTVHDRYPTYFAGSIDFAGIKPEAFADISEQKVLQKFINDERFSLYDLIKTIDPYASLAHDYLAIWLQDEMEKIFEDLPHALELFAHHTSDYERELRVSEGASITIDTVAHDNTERTEVMAECFGRISTWIGQRLYPLWDEINNLVVRKTILSKEDYVQELNDVSRKYNLPIHLHSVISQLQPTEKQLKLLKGAVEVTWNDPQRTAKLENINNKLAGYARKKTRNAKLIQEAQDKLSNGEGSFDDLIGLLTLIQSSQIYDNDGLAADVPKLNDGYNIPGVPGTAMTYSFNSDNKLNIKIGWLLSTKGMSELWLGSILKRKERRDR